MSVQYKEKKVSGKVLPRDRVFSSPRHASDEISNRFQNFTGSLHTVKRRSNGYAVISVSWDEFIDSKLYKKK